LIGLPGKRCTKPTNQLSRSTLHKQQKNQPTIATQQTPPQKHTTIPADMLTLHLGDRSRHFKQLNLLQRHRLARSDNDPLSATSHQHELHRDTLLLLHDILTQEWSILNLQRRFLQSRASYFEFISKTDVVEKLLAALWAYEKCLTHRAFYDPRGVVKYDPKEFESRLFGTVATLHLLGSPSSSGLPSSDPSKVPSVRYGAVRGPVRTGWNCTREAESWRANMHILLDPGKGKLRVKEWEYEAVGLLADGLISVTFLDGEGEDAREISLDEALPREVVDHFAEENVDDGVVFDMGFLKAEIRLSFRMKRSCRGSGVVEAGDGGDGGDAGGDDAAVVVSEQRPPISLRLRSKVAETVKD
jgi:hypothetical protein